MLVSEGGGALRGSRCRYWSNGAAGGMFPPNISTVRVRRKLTSGVGKGPPGTASHERGSAEPGSCGEPLLLPCREDHGSCNVTSTLGNAPCTFLRTTPSMRCGTA
jgi:hypothetical protein